MRAIRGCVPVNSSRHREISKATYGDHDIIIYSDLNDFRKIYSYHAKESLEENNEIVLIATTTYESPDKVKNNLESAGINVSRHLEGGSLVVIDSVRGYHMPDVYGVLKLLESLQIRGRKEGKSGVVDFADPGSFFLLDRKQELVNYELTVPKKLDIRLKTFCCYHKEDFDTFTDRQRQDLLEGHHRVV